MHGGVDGAQMWKYAVNGPPALNFDVPYGRLLPDESRATLTGETGTYLYMAPEVMR